MEPAAVWGPGVAYELREQKPGERVRIERCRIEQLAVGPEDIPEVIARVTEGPEVSEEVFQALVTRAAAIEDREKALGDMMALLNFVMDETGYKFRVGYRHWSLTIMSKALAAGGKHVDGPRSAA